MASLIKGLISDSPEPAVSCGEDIFRTVFEQIQTGIFIVDAKDHIILDANPNAVSLLGRAKGDLLGNSCHEFICPAKCGECPVSDFHREVRNTEQIVINLAGEKIPVLKTVARVKIHDKDYLLESFVDIRDQKKSEERKGALIAFMNEAVMRVRKPLELTQQNLQVLADQVRSGDYDAEDIRMQLQIHANNIAQMVKTLEDLSEQAVKEQGIKIPEHFTNFCLGK